MDKIELTPCKGCKHAERYERTDGTAGYYCGHPQNTFVFGDRWDRVFKPVKEPDDFCSFGEPKDGGNENAADCVEMNDFCNYGERRADNG